MSFKLFIYYCALCGGWAALLVWLVVQTAGILERGDPTWQSTQVAGILGVFLAVAVGGMDALLNAVGLQRFVRVLVCVAVGLLGGLLGGFLGGWLHARLGVPMVVGWVLVGVSIGAAIGVYDVLRALGAREDLRTARRKVVNGALGGLLGGLLGGFLFEGLQVSARMTAVSLTRTSLAVGLVCLGLFIGLLIGLAQVFLTEAWVKVEKGFRAGRELMLSKEETTIGRAEGCDLGLFGDSSVERRHARILLKDRRYLLADAGTEGGTFLNDQPVSRPTPLRDGDVIRVGNSILRFGEREKKGTTETQRHREEG
jgi:MFS family permease